MSFSLGLLGNKQAYDPYRLYSSRRPSASAHLARVERPRLQYGPGIPKGRGLRDGHVQGRENLALINRSAL